MLNRSVTKFDHVTIPVETAEAQALSVALVNFKVAPENAQECDKDKINYILNDFERSPEALRVPTTDTKLCTTALVNWADAHLSSDSNRIVERARLVKDVAGRLALETLTGNVINGVDEDDS